MVNVDMTLDFTTILSAHERIQPHIHRTAVLTSSRLDEASGASLFFKCENFQKIGAFKARGATNAVFSLDDATAQRGVATQAAIPAVAGASTISSTNGSITRGASAGYRST